MNCEKVTKAEKRQQEFLFEYRSEDVQHPLWCELWSRLNWREIQHVITKCEVGEELVRYMYGPGEILGSVECSKTKGGVKDHVHFIVRESRELDHNAREKIKRRFYKEVKGLSKRNIPTGNATKLLDNVVKPRCPQHAVNMLQYVFKDKGQTDTHWHQNPVACYENIGDYVVRHASAFRSCKEMEAYHMYPPLLFNRNLENLVREGVGEYVGVTCVCHMQSQKLAFNKELKMGDKQTIAGCRGRRLSAVNTRAVYYCWEGEKLQTEKELREIAAQSHKVYEIEKAKRLNSVVN